MIPRFAPNYTWNEIFKCFLPADPQAISKLEAAMAKKSGQTYAISFRYGRTGLFYLLKALGARGKKVILPSYTCVVMAHAIVLSGNIPVFLDNAEGYFQPRPEDYLKAIDSNTIMIIPTHLFGIAEETKDLYHRIKKEFPDVFVLQDCAHSFFCESGNNDVVSLYGDGALYAMNISKLVNAVFGGMLTLQDKELADNIRSLVRQDQENMLYKTSLKARLYVFCASFAFSRIFYRILYFLTHKTSILKKQTDYYNPFTIELPKDFFCPMLPFEAGIGLESLKKYDKRVLERRKIAYFYWKQLKDIPNIVVPIFKKGNTWSHFPILIPIALKEKFINELKNSCFVEIGKIVDYSVADLPAYQKHGHKDCPLASYTASRIINLPLCLGEGVMPLSPQDKQKCLIHIIETIKKVLANYKGG